MAQKKTIILGSSSAYRRQVLDQLAPELTYRVVEPDIDEKAIRHASPIRLTMALASAKGDAVVRKVSEPCVIITVDSVAVFGGAIREKPVDAVEAARFLRDYGGADEPVTFVTSICITELVPGVAIHKDLGCDTAYVTFDRIPNAAIHAAILRGTVFKTAGAVVIEDPAIAPYIKLISNGNGPPDARSSVMGLPRLLMLKMLRDFGAI